MLTLPTGPSVAAGSTLTRSKKNQPDASSAKVGTTSRTNANQKPKNAATAQRNTEPVTAPTPTEEHVSRAKLTDTAAGAGNAQSFSRKKKVEECNCRNPKNVLQFIPTTEPWTWTTRLEEQQPRPSTDIHYPSNHDTFRGDPSTCNKGRLASLEHPPRWDTYIPPADWNQDSYIADWSAPPPQQQPNPTQAITPSNPNPPH